MSNKKQTTAKKPKAFTSFKRFITIERLHEILKSKSLTFSDPKWWKDQNDIASIRAFCRLKGKKTGKDIKARAICFAKGKELFHHWSEYCKDNKQGCYIEFNEKELFKAANDKRCFLRGSVKYKPSEKVTAKFLKEQSDAQIPFLKRRPYECEKEYRIIWFGTGEAPPLKFEMTAIRRIVLAPMENAEKIQKELREKYKIRVDLSRIEESDRWIKRFNNLCKEDK